VVDVFIVVGMWFGCCGEGVVVEWLKVFVDYVLFYGGCEVR